MKPKMTFNFRISIDDCHKQRFTENEIMAEFKKDNVTIQRGLLIRKNDGAVMGGFLDKKNIKDITDGDVIELAKLIKTNDWNSDKEVTYWDKFQGEPFFEMFGHCKSIAINSVYFDKDVWNFLTSKGYDVGEFKERPVKVN